MNVNAIIGLIVVVSLVLMFLGAFLSIIVSALVWTEKITLMGVLLFLLSFLLFKLVEE